MWWSSVTQYHDEVFDEDVMKICHYNCCDEVFDEVFVEVLYQNCCDEDVMKFCHSISRWRFDEDVMKFCHLIVVMKIRWRVKRVVKRL